MNLSCDCLNGEKLIGPAEPKKVSLFVEYSERIEKSLQALNISLNDLEKQIQPILRPESSPTEENDNKEIKAQGSIFEEFIGRIDSKIHYIRIRIDDLKNRCSI